jgi:hypothetical protein
MKGTTAFLAVIILGAACCVYADYVVSDHGDWPQSWPKELEPLRKQSSSIEGGLVDLATHRIPFTKREEFESTWPHLLKVKTKGAPIVLVRSPASHWHFGKMTAGVLVHCPPSQNQPAEPAGPIEGATKLRERWMWTTYIELVVDGEIVDLNRIELPADTPIIDQRFADQDQAPKRSGE